MSKGFGPEGTNSEDEELRVLEAQLNEMNKKKARLLQVKKDNLKLTEK